MPIDKQCHLWWGMAMMGLLWPVTGYGGLAIVVAVGALKEIVDSRGYGTPDKYDFLVTCLGGVFAAAWFWVAS
mgnify:CR=1 FL=1